MTPVTAGSDVTSDDMTVRVPSYRERRRSGRRVRMVCARLSDSSRTPQGTNARIDASTTAKSSWFHELRK